MISTSKGAVFDHIIVSSQKLGAEKTDHLIESRKEAPSLPDNQRP